MKTKITTVRRHKCGIRVALTSSDMQFMRRAATSTEIQRAGVGKTSYREGKVTARDKGVFARWRKHKAAPHGVTQIKWNTVNPDPRNVAMFQASIVRLTGQQ